MRHRSPRHPAAFGQGVAYAGLQGGWESLYSRPMREPGHMRRVAWAAGTDRSITSMTMGGLNAEDHFRSRPECPKRSPSCPLLGGPPADEERDCDERTMGVGLTMSTSSISTSAEKNFGPRPDPPTALCCWRTHTDRGTSLAIPQRGRPLFGFGCARPRSAIRVIRSPPCRRGRLRLPANRLGDRYEEATAASALDGLRRSKAAIASRTIMVTGSPPSMPRKTTRCPRCPIT